jgi:hypothetical protein
MIELVGVGAGAVGSAVTVGDAGGTAVGTLVGVLEGRGVGGTASIKVNADGSKRPHVTELTAIQACGSGAGAR